VTHVFKVVTWQRRGYSHNNNGKKRVGYIETTGGTAVGHRRQLISGKSLEKIKVATEVVSTSPRGRVRNDGAV